MSSSSSNSASGTASASASASATPARRARSRTSTLSFAPPLPPLISRENSLEDIPSSSTPASTNINMATAIASPPAPADSDALSFTPKKGTRSFSSLSIDIPRASPSSSTGTGAGAGTGTSPSRLYAVAGPSRPPHTRASKSVSRVFPTASPKRSSTANLPPPSASAGAGTSPQLRPDGGLKRRISTPLMPKLVLEEEDQAAPAGPYKGVPVGKGQGLIGKEGEKENASGAKKSAPSRARSTSTSIAVPASVPVPEPTIAVAPPSRVPATTSRNVTANVAATAHAGGSSHRAQPPTWPGLLITPSTPPEDDSDPSTLPASASLRGQGGATGVLTSMYNAGESSVRRLAGMVLRQSTHAPAYRMHRRGSDEDSEKGLDTDDGSLDTAARSSVDTDAGGEKMHAHARGSGKYYGAWTGQGDGYFSLPPTPPEDDGERDPLALENFGDALERSGRRAGPTLPTPALSAHSLRRRSTSAERAARQGWLGSLLGRLQWDADGKTGQVIRDLGWTVGGLVLAFFASLGMVLWLLQGLPITTLKHLPKSTTDVQLLSAEIRAYMSSSSGGWWHTVGVLTYVGCWKHAWSVPGAVVLNILVGSILEPIPALGLLTIITATGSLGSFLLSSPLAPLIAVLFPKPLSLVRAALAPDSTPPATHHRPTPPHVHERVTPVHLEASAAAAAPQPTAIWRRLLVMRAMGIVPWSGMNVACGVVGVDWRVFWLTTAAGSASWSYVTASVGNILSRLAIPSDAGDESGAGLAAGAGAGEGESLTSLLRDPTLIAKLVFLTGLTLLQVLLKRRNGANSGAGAGASPGAGAGSVIAGNEAVSAVVPLDSYDGPDFDSEEEGDEKAVLARREARMMESVQRAGADAASPTSPLVASIRRFTPMPAAFDLLSFGRTAGRTAGRWVGGVGRGVGGVWGRVVG